jgi:hypothetical protein
MVLAGSLSAQAGLAIHGPATYTPGEVITITLTGDSEGRLDALMHAVVAFSAERGVVEPVAATRGDLETSAGVLYWLHFPGSGSVDGCGTFGLATNACLAVSAYEAYLLEGTPTDLLPSTLSTWQFDTTDARGDLVFTLAPGGVGFFDFPAATPLVVVGPIPEPVSVALVGLGLVAIGVARRGGRV